MARTGVDYETVERVARTLISQGESPSVQKIREKLGTGSNTTIATHLKTWRANLASNSPALPESVPDELMNPLDDFWSLAVAKAETNYQILKEELEAKVVTVKSAYEDIEVQLVEKTREIENLQQTFTNTQNQLRETEEQWYTLQGKHTVAENELKHAHAELERIHGLLQEQKQAFEVERNQLIKTHEEALQYERERATATENRLLQEIDQLRQKKKNLESELTAQQQTYLAQQEQTLQHKLALEQKIAELTVRNEQHESIQNQNQQAVETMNIQLTAVQEQLSMSLDTVEALRKALEQSKDNEIKLTTEICQLKEINIQLQTSK